jgi:hypothetical protein
MAGRYSLFASLIGVKLASDDDRQTAARELVDHRQHSEGTPIPASGLADNRCRRRSSSSRITGCRRCIERS